MEKENSSHEGDWLPSVFDEWLEWRCDDKACAACRHFANDIFEPATEPHMPPEDCTCEGGCKCKYVLVPYPPEDDPAPPPN
jgi:hypothetical protein